MQITCLHTGLAAALVAVVVGMLGLAPDRRPDSHLMSLRFDTVQHNPATDELLPLHLNHLRSIDDGPVVVLSSGSDLVALTPTVLTSGVRTAGQRINPGELLLSGSIINQGAGETTLVTMDGKFIVLWSAMNFALTRQTDVYREFCLCWCEQQEDYVAIAVPHRFHDMREFCNGAAGVVCGCEEGQQVFNDCMVGYSLKANGGGERK